jgi:hypothetical protein
LQIVTLSSGIFNLDLYGLFSKNVLVHFENFGTVVDHICDRIVLRVVSDLSEVHAKD